MSGPPTPVGGQQSASPSLLHSNSGILGGYQGGSMPPQSSYSSLVSPGAQYNSSMFGNNPNLSSYLNQTLGNGGSNAGFSGMGGFQRGNVDNPTESNPLCNIASDIGFHASPSSFAMTNMANSGYSAQMQKQQIQNISGNPMLSEQSYAQAQQFELQNFQNGQWVMQRLPMSHTQLLQYQLHQNQQPQFQGVRGGLANMGPAKLEEQTYQQPQFQAVRGGLANMVPVKSEQQMFDEPIGPQQQLEMQSFQNIGSVSQEPKLNQIGRGVGLAHVKLEHQHSDQAMFLQQQQQQHQQLLHLSKKSSQAAAAQMNFLQQQRILQFQRQQQQQMLKAPPQQQPQTQQQLPELNMPPIAAMRPLYEPGSCALRLNQYIYQQKQRPEDNNIEFWQKFVGEFFAPDAKKRWCVSMYGNSRQTNGVFPQDLWHCQICNHKPGRGFEATVEVLPRLFKIKYDSGTLEELLYVDMPREYQNASGQVVLDYAKVTQESVLEHLRVARGGQLRIVFSPDLKICSWEFCARHHEELIPRKLIVQQVSQLGAAVKQYQASVQSASPSPDILSNCNMFVKSARQLAKSLEVPLVNDFGYTKSYVRCLQVSEVANCMKDLIDCSQETGSGGPIECLEKFPRLTRTQCGPHNSAQQPEEPQQTTRQNLKDEHHSAQVSVMLPSTSNADDSHCKSTTTSATNNTVGLLRQDSTNSRAESQINNPGSPYTGGTSAQITSAGSSSTLTSAQANPSSPLSSPTPSSPTNPPQSFHNYLGPNTANSMNITDFPAQIPSKQPSSLNGADPSECLSSVDKILQEVMSSPQFGGAANMASSATSVGGNAVKNFNGPSQTNGNSLSGDNGLVGSSSNMGNGGFGNIGGANGLSASVNGSRAAMGSNSMTGRVGVPVMPQGTYMSPQQQELPDRFRHGLGSGNGFNNRF